MSMKIVCAWCHKTISEGDEQDSPVSHGICQECAKKVKQELDEMHSQPEQPTNERRS